MNEIAVGGVGESLIAHQNGKSAPLTPSKIVQMKRGYPIVGVIPDLLRDPPGFLQRVTREHPGEIVGLRVGPIQFYLVTHPDHVEHVLSDRWRDFSKGGLWDAVRPLTGKGLVTNDGDFWLRQRRLIQPLFNSTHLASLAEGMVEVIDREATRLSRYGASTTIDMGKEMIQMTQQMFLKTMFGTSLTQGEAERLGNQLLCALKAINTRLFLYFLPSRFPLPRDRAFRRAVADIDEMVLGAVRARRRSGEQRNDLLSLLLHARDEDDGQGMDDRQLRDELVTLYVAGSDTTASTMTWLWYMLDRYPEVDRRLRAEVHDVLGGRKPTYADLARLSYTRRVLQEILRLYPASWIVPRLTSKDVEIGGYFIPARSPLMLCPMVTHRDPTFWSEPEAFDPDRFEPERSEGRPRYAYYPFGGGPRQCIGNTIALMEGQLITARMVQRFRPTLVPGHRVELSSQSSLKPRHGMKMTLSPAPGRVDDRRESQQC
jgi:cytochrome P450